MDSQPRRRLAHAGSAAAFALAAAGTACAGDAPPGPSYGERVRELALAGSARAGAARVEVEVGVLDPRLRLAPCERVEPFLPPGARLWGRTRVGLRCTLGPSRWTVYLPVTVKVYATALVAVAPLPAGAVVNAADLRPAEADLAAAPTPALTEAHRAVGRTLARALHAGQTLREADLRAREWFAAGETVRVVTGGAGFSVSGEAYALTAGIEGRPARVRTPSGRVLTGMPVAQGRLAVAP